MYLLQCNGCRAQAFTEDVSDPDTLVECLPDGGCCLQDHHHGRNASETGEACRPITITAMPGSVSGMTLAAGSN